MPHNIRVLCIGRVYGARQQFKTLKRYQQMGNRQLEVSNLRFSKQTNRCTSLPVENFAD